MTGVCQLSCSGQSLIRLDFGSFVLFFNPLPSKFPERVEQMAIVLTKINASVLFFFYILDIIDAVCFSFHSCTLFKGIRWELRCAESLFSKVCHFSSEQMFPNSFERAAERSRMFPRGAHFYQNAVAPNIFNSSCILSAGSHSTIDKYVGLSLSHYATCHTTEIKDCNNEKHYI